MRFIGEKRKGLYKEFISLYLPNNIKTYVEPFGGSFAVATYLFEDRINESIKYIYNDINDYGLDIKADKIHHLDYREIFKMYDSPDTLFYLDPPYYGKEFLYKGCDNFDHLALRDSIKELEGKVIMSYNNKRYILNIYEGFEIIKYKGDNFLFRDEILILNNNI